MQLELGWHSSDIKLALGWFTAKCKLVGTKMRNLQVWVEQFKYLGVLVTSEGKVEQETGRQTDLLPWRERELRKRSCQFTGRSTFLPYELWEVAERIRSQIQVTGMSSLHRVSSLSLRKRVRIQVGLLHIERGQLRGFRHQTRIPLWHLLGQVFLTSPTVLGGGPHHLPRLLPLQPGPR